MKIAGISACFPERKVSNKEIIELIEENSRGYFEGDLTKALRNIRFMLNHIGVRNRRWLGKTDYAFDYTQSAIIDALELANMKPDDIDLLIYASIDKRVAEPGMSFFVAKALGMKQVECFDVTEGCGGWVRATRIAQAYLNAGIYKNIMLVTAEYTQHEGQPISTNLNLRCYDDLEWAFASYTVGEGSTATILTAGGDDWEFTNRSFPDMADLCMCSIFEDDPQVMQFNDVSLYGKGKYRFVSYSQKMQEMIRDILFEMVLHNRVKPGEMDLFIPHTQTLTGWKEFEEFIGVDMRYQFLLPDYGNQVNNSMPAGIALARNEGRIDRGSKITGLMTAAGMSFTLFNLVY